MGEIAVVNDQPVVDIVNDPQVINTIKETVSLQEVDLVDTIVSDGDTIIDVTETTDVIVDSESSVIVSETEIPSVLVSCEQGPPGPQGIPGPTGDSASTYVAGAIIGGHRAVLFDTDGKVQYADSTDLSHVNRCMGITLNAAILDADVQVQHSKLLYESTWSWSPGVIYLGTNGLLTQTVPTTGFRQILATVVTSKSIFINIQEPIVLES